MKSSRWAIFSQLLAACLGGYVLSSLAMSLLALLLSSIEGSNPANSVLIATLLSFLLYPVIVILVFSTRSALRAWVWLGVAALLMAALLKLLMSYP